MGQRIPALNSSLPTLVELLRWRTALHPAQRIFSFLNNGEVEKDVLTFASLDITARAIAAQLQELTKSGDRALLIYPSGLEFIAAFFGCLYSATIAVPVYPPSTDKADRSVNRFRAIANDAQPSIILTTSALAPRVESLLALVPELRQARVLVTNDISTTEADRWQQPSITGASLAFLQYTSGSTGMPKGVMVSHGNLLHNLSVIERTCQQPEEAIEVIWLPPYHDLGLIGGILQPLYSGFESVILAPTAFLQKPVRWLQAISRVRATISGAPNFAYDLCARKVTAEQKETLDLSSWMAAANGAEPVRAETIDRFASAFASCGFRREAFLPCYGLAEATLFVCGGLYGAESKIFDNEAIAKNEAVEVAPETEHARTLVSLGPLLEGHTLAIVDGETLQQSPAGTVGEIWIAGPSVAQGYWRHPQESEQTYGAYMADTNAGPFMRTGDLGFIYQDELYITGRLKDLIIIRGNNHYPQDIEKTVEQSHPALRASGGAAFSIDVEGEERLVIVAEIERQYLHTNLDEVVGRVRQAVAEQHELQLYALVLIMPATLLKTSSGKVQRRACKESYLRKDLKAVYEWSSGIDTLRQPTPIGEGEEKVDDVTKGVVQAQVQATKEDIQFWLLANVAQQLRINARDIDIHAPLSYYGMDSVHAVSMAGELETWLGREVSPTLAYDYPTIDAIARYLAGEASATETDAHANDKREGTREAIAVIGIGCRFPGASGPDDFWLLLHEGKEAITQVPPERWDLQEFYDSRRATPGKMHTRWGGFLEGIDLFDASFFSISPREATSMDPQQRLLLEVAWEALEHAGLARSIGGTQTGVFIGISSTDYAQLRKRNPELVDAYTGTGNAHSIAANRLSYFLDLRGPSIAIDTACSSSLVAVHMACQSLRNGECTMALAGGVNVLLSPELTIAFSQAQMMSATGHCKTFDDDADGYVRAEGCGIVLLKPLSQATRDGDNILAVIRGMAINQDGRSNGLTAPNGPAQEAVIRQALHNAAIAPNQVSYVETHGSSTPLGDPIEFAALKAVLMRDRSPEQTCVIGSVKTNVGHLEAAAGIAGLIKTVLSLYKEEIPAHLHLKKLNQHISLDGTTFQFPLERRPWPTSERRIAGVSAFGFGGTNVHVIVEAAPRCVVPTNEFERPAHVLTLSAHSESALRTLAERYNAFLAGNSTYSLADICHSANTGRARFAQRAAIQANSTKQLRERLTAFSQGAASQGVQYGKIQRGEHFKTAFLFTGQGSQYVGMGRWLYNTQPTFRRALDRCDGVLRPYLGQSLLAVLYPDPGVESLLNETAYTQPALFSLEYALAELWRSWGIEPAIVMGHSVGEYVAACIAGAFTLEDGLKLIAERGRLMQELPKDGMMAVVFAEPKRLEELVARFSDSVAIATYNGPENTVISGERKAVQAVQQALEAQGVVTHALEVSHAFHSPLMEPMLSAFEQTASTVESKPLRMPLVSNLTGSVVKPGELLDARYWREQTRGAVQFLAGICTLVESGYHLFLELGPTSTLISQGERCQPGSNAIWLPSLQKGRDDWDVLLHTLSTLNVKGVDLDWQGFDKDYARSRVPLPTYPFERKRYWMELETTSREPVSAPQAVHAQTNQHNGRHPLLDMHTQLAYPIGTHIWETSLQKLHLPYLGDHRIQGMMALPISAYIEMLQSAAIEAFGREPYVLKNLELKKILFLLEQDAQKVQIVFSESAPKQISFRIYSHAPGLSEQPPGNWALHASGELAYG